MKKVTAKCAWILLFVVGMFCSIGNGFSQSVNGEMSIDLSHKVKKGETMYAIGKKYHCTIEELKLLNPGIGMLKTGMRIKVKQKSKIPTKSKSIEAPNLNPLGNISPSPVQKTESADNAPSTIDHVVVQGETLYSISKKYGVSIDNILRVNNLQSDKLSISQKLSISGFQNSSLYSNNVLKDPEYNYPIPPNQMQGGMPEMPAIEAKTSLKEYEKTMHAQIGFDGLQANRSWVMVNDHKKGEVIALVNPANSAMVYCTVMGSMPNKSNSQIALSESVATRLGIGQQNTVLQLFYAAP